MLAGTRGRRSLICAAICILAAASACGTGADDGLAATTTTLPTTVEPTTTASTTTIMSTTTLAATTTVSTTSPVPATTVAPSRLGALAISVRNGEIVEFDVSDGTVGRQLFAWDGGGGVGASVRRVDGRPEIYLCGTQRLPRFTSKALAMDMILTARMIDAQEALRAGLVSRVVPADKLLEEALAMAAKIADYSLPVVMMAKESVNRAYETALAEGVLFERRLFHSQFALDDQKEGMAAFVEKRTPTFKHK
jgi:hypothetical protein